jgi:predicted nucleic acid-binding protein
VIVTAVTLEAPTIAVQEWLAARATDDLLVSDWVTTEVSSALSIKLRRGDIDLAQRAGALAAFNRMCVDTLTVLPVVPAHFQIAAHFSDRHDLGLRGSDALHLAVCADNGASLVTLDVSFRKAALEFGVPVETI